MALKSSNTFGQAKVSNVNCISKHDGYFVFPVSIARGIFLTKSTLFWIKISFMESLSVSIHHDSRFKRVFEKGGCLMEGMVPSTTRQVTRKGAPTRRKANWRDYLSVTKPGINISNLMAVFTGIWLAGAGTVDLAKAVVIILGTALVIAGGGTLNNYIDRDIDPLMTRTKDRPLASQRIQPRIALGMGSILSVAGILLLAWGSNLLAAILAWLGLMVYVVLYSMWLKRVTPLNTAVGSISGAIPPMIGWAAVTGAISGPAWILFAILFFWQPSHFYALAMCKVDEYRMAGIPMFPVVKGFFSTVKRTVLWVFCLVLVSFLLPVLGLVGSIYMISAAISGLIYLALSLSGLFMDEHTQWAKHMFTYSLVYLTTIQLAILIDVALI